MVQVKPAEALLIQAPDEIHEIDTPRHCLRDSCIYPGNRLGRVLQ